MTTRDILIVGATGQQGRATIAALTTADRGSSPIRILALTRSLSSPKSKSLEEAYPSVVLIEGDTRDPEPIFERCPSISSVFLVTVPSDEETQAVPLIDAALKPERQVDHVVFSSVDRGGEIVSWDNPTDVPHFAAKHRIEHHLRQACEKAGKRWTILRPTGFMDNYSPNFFGKLMATLWETSMPAECKMQLVSTHDIGVFAAKALLQPDRWSGRAVGLAGDEVTFAEFQHKFKETVGFDLPTTYTLVARPVIWWVEEARRSFEWFSTAGYRVDIDQLRQEEPALQTVEDWLAESSRWKCKVEN